MGLVEIINQDDDNDDNDERVNYSRSRRRVMDACWGGWDDYNLLVMLLNSFAEMGNLEAKNILKMILNIKNGQELVTFKNYI